MRRKDLKKAAKSAMRGKTGYLMLPMLLYTALNFLGSMLAETFFPGTDPAALVISEAFSFILTLVLGVFYAGVSYLYLNAAREQEYSWGDLIYFFKHDPDKAIVVTFVPSIINLLVSIPLSIYNYYAEIGTTVQAQMQWAGRTLVLTLLTIAMVTVLTTPFEMVYYLLADHPEMSGTDALKNSVYMMRGNVVRLLLLKISFIPLMLLSVFTLYLALLWIIPYMEMTTVMFYRELQGELEANFY